MKISKDKQNDFFIIFRKSRALGQREGQSYMNALWHTDVDLYGEITGGDLDPFYLDSRVPAFLQWLSEKD